jgi:hypothetical protein
VTKKNDAGLEFAIHKTDIVGLVHQAWLSSYRKAISSRGWGPRALSFNALLHPEILASKSGNSSKGSVLESTIDPEELNLSEGLAATLVERIVLYKNDEARRNGADADENRRKRKATAEERLSSQEKWISAGLLAAGGHYQLNSDVRDYVKGKAAAAREKEYEKYYKQKDEHDALYAKVEAIRSLNLPSDKWNQAQLKVMVRWYKRDGDEKLPSKKQDQLARYNATCPRADMPPPQPPDDLPPLNTDTIIDPVNNGDDVNPVASNINETDEEEVARILLAAGNFHE